MNLDLPSSTTEPACYLPSPHLVALLEEMKSSGELQGLDEWQRMEAIVSRMNASSPGGSRSTPNRPPIELTPKLAEILRQVDTLLEVTRSGPLAELAPEQVMRAIVSWRHAEVQRQQRARSEPSPFRLDHEFAEVLGRVDAARDAEGVPNDLRVLEDFLTVFITYLDRKSLFPSNSVMVEWTVDALAINGMAASARTRLSVILWVMLNALDRAIDRRTDRNRAKRHRRKGRR